MKKLTGSARAGLKDQSDLGQKIMTCNMHLNSCSSDKTIAVCFAYQEIILPKILRLHRGILSPILEVYIDGWKPWKQNPSFSSTTFSRLQSCFFSHSQDMTFDNVLMLQAVLPLVNMFSHFAAGSFPFPPSQLAQLFMTKLLSSVTLAAVSNQLQNLWTVPACFFPVQPGLEKGSAESGLVLKELRGLR